MTNAKHLKLACYLYEALEIPTLWKQDELNDIDLLRVAVKRIEEYKEYCILIGIPPYFGAQIDLEQINIEIEETADTAYFLGYII